MKLSIIVPAYNEEKRIEKFAKDLIEFANEKLEDYEIIFVDDGSQDKTLKKLEDIRKISSIAEKIRIITYQKNRGKGYAVRKGVLEAGGDNILFIDADGSISPKEIPRMTKRLERFDIVIGNRSSKDSKIEQPPLRVLTGTIFSILANVVFPIGIKDTVCGFKGFKKNVAKDLFKDLKSTGWVFDVELLYKAKKKKNSIYKLPLAWEHKEGTRMKLHTPILMIAELVRLKRKMIKEKNIFNTQIFKSSINLKNL
ncbi:MAG: glycosyltransferase family 2 protein [Candidatus Pacearchaeota archaeon]|jgi:dolichyl-phosphate beta-glucosyltransferase